jgi:hypothetical protein
MVIGLDSARKQLQWRLIYANFDVNSGGFGGPASLFGQRPVVPYWTETATTESYAATDAKGDNLHSEASTIEGE